MRGHAFRTRDVGWAGKAPVAGGVALIGHVDTERGIWRMIDPVHVHPLPLADQLTEATGLPLRATRWLVVEHESTRVSPGLEGPAARASPAG
ncbi:hypothetical protein ACFL6X_03180 [Candidatus Latescibacterota bacterium]